MAASVDSATPPPPPAAVAAEEAGGGDAEQARTLIGALNLLSRNLPLPPAVLRAVSSIYHDGEDEDGDEEEAEEEEPAAVGDDGEPAASREGEVRVGDFSSLWCFRLDARVARLVLRRWSLA
jgi:SWI/SNF-related matrix-associated actin-dependent regulator of chromatin subfamily A protein 2/4